MSTPIVSFYWETWPASEYVCGVEWRCCYNLHLQMQKYYCDCQSEPAFDISLVCPAHNILLKILCCTIEFWKENLFYSLQHYIHYSNSFLWNNTETKLLRPSMVPPSYHYYIIIILLTYVCQNKLNYHQDFLS